MLSRKVTKILPKVTRKWSNNFSKRTLTNLKGAQKSNVREGLLCKIKDPAENATNKVSVIGAGNVGVSCASSILFQRISNHVALIDIFPPKLEGEVVDFRHGSVYLDDPRIQCSTDFSASRDSKVVIITAGSRQEKGESRLSLMQKNVKIMKKIIPPLVQCSPEAVFIMVSNPVDILSWITWKIGDLPVDRVIGSGTHLDSARFRHAIADRIGISPSSIQAHVIGEHGDSQVPLWSGVSVAGMQLREISPNLGLTNDEEKWNEISESVVKSGSEVRFLKGYSNTAIGLSVADITKAILGNQHSIKTVSTLVQGHHGINHEMFLSLPCVIDANGVTHIVRMRITQLEEQLLQKSAERVYEAQKMLKL